MSFLPTYGTIFFVLVLWRVIKWLTAEKSPLAGLAGPEKDHWLKGNYHRIFQDGLEYNLRLSEKYGGAVKIHGLFGEEHLYISDPRALHHIVVKDQHVYEETDMFIMGNKLIFGEGLVATVGDQHKKQRKMLNPIFSLSNMKDLLPILQPVANQLCAVLVSQLPLDRGAEEIDLLPWMSRTSFEYICQAGWGHSFNALDTSRRNEYTEAIRTLGATTVRLILLRPFIPFTVRNISLYWRNKMVSWSPIKALKKLGRIVKIMDETSKKVLSERRSTLEYANEINRADARKFDGNLSVRQRGKDILSIMLEANAALPKGERLTEEELLGQMNILIFAGFETTSAALSRILFILAQRPEVQARLRTEIRKAKCDYVGSTDISENGIWKDVELPYDVLMSLPYLDAILRETLRVHPPTSLLGRTTKEETTLPLQYPVRSISGSEISSIRLRENTNVIISILASNHNKQIWGEDASVWRPERWLTPSGERVGVGSQVDGVLEDPDGLKQRGGVEGTPGNKGGVKYPGVYASMMTFLGGGRACIGFKFAEMEMKQVIATLLCRLHFSLPSSVDENGNTKEIYWKISALQIPVVRPPAGDGTTPQAPLTIRLVRDDDFLA